MSQKELIKDLESELKKYNFNKEEYLYYYNLLKRKIDCSDYLEDIHDILDEVLDIYNISFHIIGIDYI